MTIALRPLTLVDEGDEVLVGELNVGTFVAVPAVGGVVIRALQRGATLDEVAAEAQRHAGEPVDVGAFVEALRELGFVAGPGEAVSLPARTAPVQQRRWVAGLPQRYARPLFGPVAWAVYAAALLFCVGCFVLRPGLWPRPARVGDNGYVVIVALLASYPLTALHELWHWLAARALGLSARFGIDRRLYFLVFETDLSQLWSVPRRQRYGPQLAGLAIDSVSLATLLAVQSAVHSAVLSALIYFKITTMLWQCMVFLRTDLYGVLVTATGCHDLWRVKSLLLRRALRRLTAAQAAELAAAAPRDVQVGRWFRWVYLAGFLFIVGYAGYFFIPAMGSLLAWSYHGLAVGPAYARFWLTAGDSTVLYLPLLTALAIGLAGGVRSLRSRSASAAR